MPDGPVGLREAGDDAGTTQGFVEEAQRHDEGGLCGGVVPGVEGRCGNARVQPVLEHRVDSEHEEGRRSAGL